MYVFFMFLYIYIYIYINIYQIYKYRSIQEVYIFFSVPQAPNKPIQTYTTIIVFVYSIQKRETRNLYNLNRSPPQITMYTDTNRSFVSPPDLPFLKFCNFWKISKRYFDVFGRFSKFI